MHIGFTGHRPNRLKIGAARIRAHLDHALRQLVAEAHRQTATAQITAISALAEGSDRIFAESALDLGLVLEALLPMPTAEYIGTFSDKSTLGQFETLLARASKVEALPGSRTDSKTAYETLGNTMVERCDLLVTVWDGKAAAGRGGTTDVIERALVQGRRVIWIDAATDQRPRLLLALHPINISVPMRE